MSAETGHAANRTYIAQDGSIHLNGAALYDASEVDISSYLSGGASNNAGLTPASVTLTSFLALKHSNVTAAGSAQANAANLATGFNYVISADNTTGVILPTPSAFAEVVVVKNATSGKTLVVYPHLSGNIDGATANASANLSSLACGMYFAHNATTWTLKS